MSIKDTVKKLILNKEYQIFLKGDGRVFVGTVGESDSDSVLVIHTPNIMYEIDIDQISAIGNYKNISSSGIE